MAGLALIVMISASFNYVNLSIARGLARAKEVGIRKVSGATRKQLISQFLLEAVILSVLALVLSNVILIALRPAFENLNFSKLLYWDLEQNTYVYLLSLLFAIVVGLISGFIPATLLSAFKPIKVLKDLSGIRLMSKTGLRKFLIVVQFSISLVFIITVTLVSRQLDFMINSNFGFETENIVNLRLDNANYQQLKTVMKSDSRIKNVSGATHIPAAGTTRNEDLERVLFDGEGISTGYFSVDEDYMAALGLNLVAGTNFQQLNANSNEIIINETGVETFGFNSTFEALGELLYDSDSVEYRILGVVEDYHHQAMVVHIGPMFLKYKPEDIRIMHIELFADNHENGLEAIDKGFYSVHPDLKYEHQYMDAELKFFYDLLFGDLVKMVTVATILALVIACMGLLGMATYTIETRLKEISIRKILGASDRQLIYQLSKGFIILLGVAIVLSVPFAWFVNNLWLQEIAYRIDMNVDVALIGVGILSAVGIVTIGSQTYKASSTAPIDNLRNE